MTNQTVKNNRITALYLRLSQEDEREGESNSIANQRDILTRYAQINGFPNIREFIDDGYTGVIFDTFVASRIVSMFSASTKA